MKISLGLFAVGFAEKDGTFVQDESASRFICGGDITDDGLITSPGLDDPDRGFYYNNLNCTWEIDIQDALSLTIFPEVFEVEHGGLDEGETTRNCNYDTLFIRWSDAAYNNTDVEYQFCSVNGYLDNEEPYTTQDYTTLYSTYYTDSGRKRRAGLKKQKQGLLRTAGNYVGDFTGPIQIDGGRATIKFQTDYSVIKKGFQLRIESEQSCDEVQNGSGTITSPGYPLNYNHYQRCVYTLNADPGKMIKITFNDFEVEDSRWCKYDSFLIMGRKHCGNIDGDRSPESVVLVHAESTDLVWDTDHSVSEKGFSFSWESVDNPIEIPSGPLESAAGFHAHMELFLLKLEYQMEKIRPRRLTFLHRAWDHVQIDEAHFQTEGDCSSGANYETFEYKEFDNSATICTNLDNFASNARQFFDNFVCMDDHETPNMTMRKWHRKANKIERIAEKIRDRQTAICMEY